MLRTGIIGIGAMGRGHLDNLIRMKSEQNRDVDLVAICDIDENKFRINKIDFNLDIGNCDCDFSAYNCYTDADEMLEKEELDLVLLILPTYIHCEYTVKCLDKGINVFCEKPMALNPKQCRKMIDAAERNNKKLMIGHCLRFSREYEIVKEVIDSGRYGKPIAGYFFRGGKPAKWSYNNWILKRECGGGAILDQHVHDVDIVNYFFGIPKAVTTLGKNLIEGSSYDTLSTHYIYDDCKVVNAQNDGVLANVGFTMAFRLNFENGTITLSENGLIAATRNEEPYTPEYDRENVYYSEIKYFADCIMNDKPLLKNPPEESMDAIRVVMAEIESADNNGRFVDVK